MALGVRDLIQRWLDEGRAAWISSQGLHPFALMNMRADALALEILTHVTEAPDSPGCRGGLDATITDKQQLTLPVPGF